MTTDKEVVFEDLVEFFSNQLHFRFMEDPEEYGMEAYEIIQRYASKRYGIDDDLSEYFGDAFYPTLDRIMKIRLERQEFFSTNVI